ncbi:myrosinase 1-like [Diabrotica undecimpunctata]|uniref:myrosinase 1-like n=1 Tax=Diabrotica undecimpunctata TaxID=50387 RepID=UPI003B63FC67
MTYPFVILILVHLSTNVATSINNHRFPSDFLWGASTSAFQFEGAWNEDGKTPNVWDYFLHNRPDFIPDKSNADVSANAYHMVKTDVELVKSLNLKVFRTSVAWTRILPQGNEGKPNQIAINHYKNLFRLLKENNIEPLVTLSHFDLPQKLSLYGGFLNSSIVEWFTNYARICFDNFGEDVKQWATFNEPYIWCVGAYGVGFLAHSKTNPGFWEYTCGHNLLKAHAAVWHMYDEEFRPTQKGTVSLTNAADWVVPKTSSIEDKEAAERHLLFRIGWFAHPLYHGNYPSVMIENIKNISINEEGRNSSRLPEFTKEEIKYIKGTNDIFYLNTYFAHYASNVITKLPPGFDNDIRATIEEIPNGITWGIRPFISWIRKNFNNVSIMITENGKGSTDAGLQDHYRIDFMQKIFSSIRDSMEIDNATVLGYTFWSLYDGFEVQYGYKMKMGLTYIDFNSNNRTRIPRQSAYYYSNVSRTGCISNSTCVDAASCCRAYSFPILSIIMAIIMAVLTLCRC